MEKEKCILPQKCYVMNEDEMSEIYGGNYVIVNCSENYLKKNICLSQGNMLVNSGRIHGMTALEIAQELYTHAYAYYHYDRVAIISPAIAVYCYSKAADGIYIEDGGDTALRKKVYATVWNIL